MGFSGVEDEMSTEPNTATRFQDTTPGGTIDGGLWTIESHIPHRPSSMVHGLLYSESFVIPKRLKACPPSLNQCSLSSAIDLVQSLT